MCAEPIGDAAVPCWLIRRCSGFEDARFALQNDEMIIGKAAEADIHIGDDDYVSRRHARIVRSDGMFFIEDLESANGTFLKIRRPIPLESGDEIQVGDSIFRLSESNPLCSSGSVIRCS
jgi:pSer/pThr/pTyr-binding forkhead associated (FHA) protein